ncbi:MAG: extracellular solute-binding protein [Clostridiales bacterium]|nr:extracellular solute-binding protein [Clostridiales bacterium]
MKLKRLVSGIVCTAMVASMLTACGSNSGSGTANTGGAADTGTAESAASGDSAAAGDTAGAESTAAGDDAAASGGGKELVYWSMWTSQEPQALVIQEAIDAYEAKTGNTVKVEWKGRDINKIIKTALESGTKIDLFDDDFQRVSTQYVDFEADLEDMATAAGYADFSNSVLTDQVRSWAGSLKAIYYQPYTSGVFYNKDLFEQAGISEEPQTWDEFMDACQKLVDAGIEPLALDSAYAMYMYGYQLARYIGQDAVKELVKEGGWSSNEGAKKAAQDMIDAINAGYFESGAPGEYPESENQMGLTLNVAAIVMASYVCNEIETNTSAGINWGMFNYPSVEGGKDANTVANVGAQAFAIPSYSENQQEAFDLIMMIVSGEYDQKMAQQTNTIPADTRNEWPAMLADTQAKFEGMTGTYEWNMGLNDNAELQAMIKDVCIKLFEGQYETADDFVAAMDALY